NSFATYFDRGEPVGPIAVYRCNIRPQRVVCASSRGVDASKSDECSDLQKLPREHNSCNKIRESIRNRPRLKEQLRFVVRGRSTIPERKPLWPAKIDIVSLHLTALLQDRRPYVLYRESFERGEHVHINQRFQLFNRVNLLDLLRIARVQRDSNRRRGL